MASKCLNCDVARAREEVPAEGIGSLPSFRRKIIGTIEACLSFLTSRARELQCRLRF
jgi:hypothetical protein